MNMYHVMFHVQTTHEIFNVSLTQVTTLAGSTPGFADGPALSAKFSTLGELASDSGGNIFVADYKNNWIRRIDWLTRNGGPR